MEIEKKLIAHRGIFDNVKVVENTIESFQKAISLGYPFELDVQLTLDHKLVVFHDDNLERLCHKGISVKDIPYSEIYEFTLLETKSHIPLFRDVLELNQDRVLIDIEIKPTSRIPETVSILLEELEGYHNFIIKSFDPRIVRRVKALRPDFRVGLLVHDHYKNSYQKLLCQSKIVLKYSRCDFVSISKKLLLNKKYMRKISNYPTLVWTIQKKEEILSPCDYIFICNHLPFSM